MIHIVNVSIIDRKRKTIEIKPVDISQEELIEENTEKLANKSLLIQVLFSQLNRG